MSLTVFLDTGPLGIVTNPRRPPETVTALTWAITMMREGHRFMVPAIADYEVRRELERAAKTAGLAALDAWNNAEPGRYLQLTDSALRLGAKLWARLVLADPPPPT
jgi:predicted transcriptional regulator